MRIGLRLMWAGILGLFFLTSFSQTSLPLNTIVIENFNSMGSATMAMLPANWRMSAIGAGSTGNWSAGLGTTTLAASSGTPSAGGRYNWATTGGSDRALGFLSDGAYTSPNAVMAHYRNQTGSTVSELTVSFTIERYVVNIGTVTLTFQYSLDGNTWTAMPAGGISAADFPTGAAAGTFSSPKVMRRTATIAASLSNNSDIYFRWIFNTDNAGSQGLGLDDVSVFAGPATPVLTATLRDLLQVDNGAQNQFNEGDVIRYETKIKNTGSGNATGVQINLPTPANTTAVSGSVKTSTVAIDDHFSTAFNTVANSGNVLSNDVGLPLPAVLSFGPSGNAAATAAGGTGTSDNGGTLTVNADGTFSYTPPAGFSGIDKFSYIAGNGNLPNNDAIVSITVGSAASAVNDSYNVIGNVSIQPNAAQGVFTNDGGSGKAVTAVNGNAAGVGAPVMTTNGGTVTMNADGSFTYNPPAGYQGADNFTYTVDNGFSQPSTATVTLNTTGMIWFINASAQAGGDGRLSSPFHTVAAFNAVNNGTGSNPAQGQNIFIYSGNYSGSLTLLNNQKLIGAGATSSLQTITGLTPAAYSAALPATGAASPVISNNSDIIALSTGGGNLIHGLNLSPSAGSGIKSGVNGTGTNTATEVNITSSGSAYGVSLAFGGIFNYTSGSISSTSSRPAMYITGTVTMTCDVNLSQSGGTSSYLLSIDGHNTGTITFQNGTLSATQGTGVLLNNADGSYFFNGTTTLNGGDAGIDILNGSGGTIVFSAGTTITNPTGTAFNVDGTTTAVTASITYSGSITQNTSSQRLISIASMTGGSVLFNTGTITAGAASTGINLSSVNAALTFSNGVNLGSSAVPMSNVPLTITGGTGAYDFGAVNIYSTGVTAFSSTNHTTGNLTINAGIIDAVNGAALSITSAAGATPLNIGLATANSTGGTNNLSFTNCSGGIIISGGNLSGASGASFNVNGGTANITYRGGMMQGNNAAMVSVTGGHSGILTFTTGTLTASNGTGLQFDNADGNYSFSGTTVLNSGDAGIDILNGSGGSFSFNANTSINNPSGIAINITNSAANVTYSGSFTKNNNAATGINITGNTGGIININGTGTKTLSTQTASAVNITGNSGGTTVNFSGNNFLITTTTGNGFNATTISPAVTNISVAGTGNIITATGGIALNVTNTTIAASGLTFQSISANGGSNGIVLNNTGNNAGLTVTGNSNGSLGGSANVNPAGTAPYGVRTLPDPNDASGGTIQNMSGADGAIAGSGIYLENTRNISLTRMRITGTHQNHGIKGSSVNGLTLNNILMDGTFGNNVNYVTDEGTIVITNLSGTATIQNSYIVGSVEHDVVIRNSSNVTLSPFTVSNVTFGIQTQQFASDALLIINEGGGVMNATIQNSRFMGAKGDQLQYVTQNTSSSNVTIQNNVFFNENTNIASGGGNVGLATGGSNTDNSTVIYLVNGNRFRGARGAAFYVQNGAGTSTITGTISNNRIGEASIANSGSNEGDGIVIIQAQRGKNKVLIDNNQIYQYSGNAGIEILAGGATAAPSTVNNGSIHATIRRNIISNPGTNNIGGVVDGMRFENGSNSGDAYTMCLNVGQGSGNANNIANGGRAAESGMPFSFIANTLSANPTFKILGYPIATNVGTAAHSNVLSTIGNANGGVTGYAEMPSSTTTHNNNNSIGVACDLF